MVMVDDEARIMVQSVLLEMAAGVHVLQAAGVPLQYILEHVQRCYDDAGAAAAVESTQGGNTRQ